MSLIKIEMQGFKSFAPKTVINFKTGFTGIVGPNGCGKSNVADAIRWVLGERSSKQVRADSMVDVIFDGSASRKPMGYAEVSLTFDNTDRMFVLEVDEIVITRKLFRSGKSGYYINNTPTRQRDIINLMRDTGAGKEGYSIIGQGKVAEIMNAKPESRRAIFEEAAGIAKTKEEKKRTEAKLASLALEIQRGRDILAEKDAILAPLLRQVENVKKYNEYKAGLKYQEINFYLYSTDHNRQVIQQTKQRILELTEIIGDKQAEVVKNEERTNKVREQTEQIENEVRALMKKDGDLREAVAKASGEMNVYTEKLNAITRELDRLTKEKGDLESQISALDAERKEAMVILDIKKTELFNANLKLNELTAGLAAVNKELEGTESTVEQSNDEFLSAMNLLTGVKTDEAKLLAEANALRERKSTLTAEINNTRNSLALDTQKLSDAQNKISQIGRRRADTRMKRNSLSSALNETITLNRQNNDAKQKLAASIAMQEERVRSLRDSIGGYNTYQSSVRQLMSDAETNRNLSSNIIGVVGHLMQVPEKYELAIEMSLGNSIQNIVVPNEDSAKVLISYMQSNQYGRITCMPNNRVHGQKLSPEYRDALRISGVCGVASDLVKYDASHANVILNLLGRTVVVENIDVGKQLAQIYDYGFKIVTLDGTIFDPRRTITGGSVKERSAAHLGKERELNEAKEKLEKDKAELKNIMVLLDTLEKKYAELQKLQSQYRDELNNMDIEEARSATDIRNLSESTRILAERLKKLEEEKATLDIRLQNTEAALKSVALQTTNIEGQQKSTGAEIERAKVETLNKKKLRDTFTNNITNVKVLIAGLNNEINRIENDIKRFDSQHNVDTRELASVDARLSEQSNLLTAHQATKPSLTFSEKDKEELEAIGRAIKELDGKKEDLRVKQEEIDKSTKVLNDFIIKYTENKSHAESRVEKLYADIETMDNKIWNDYTMTYEDAMAERDPEFNHSDAAHQIASYRGKINQLGNINFNAMEDYQRESGERDNWAKQIEDMTSAESDLLTLLKTITDTMTEKFDTAFEQISANFQKTFSALFGGGKAELVLVDNPNEPLEKGVEIKMQPPGKNMRPLSSFSGGEQALSAIAILFAILKLRPMPFVILDEADAALDEVNAKRFALYLKRYSSETRFIIITHKKPTMEVADVLYGVTMEEQGVSKLLAVSLAEAAAMADKNKDKK